MELHRVAFDSGIPVVRIVGDKGGVKSKSKFGASNSPTQCLGNSAGSLTPVWPRVCVCPT